MQTHHHQQKNFLAEAIQNETQQLGLGLPDEVMTDLAAYAKSLWSWNDRLNLTRHTDVQQFSKQELRNTSLLRNYILRRSTL